MAEENADDEVQASLARLRLFLAPHAPLVEPKHEGDNGLASHDTGAAAGETSGDAEQQLGGQEAPDESSEELAALALQYAAATYEEAPQTFAESEKPPRCGGTEASPREDDTDATKLQTVPAVGAVASVSPLNGASKEFARVKYMLQCSMAGLRVHDDMLMWDMKNPALGAQYEARSAGLLELDSWVEVDSLSAAMGETHSYGFTQVADKHLAMKFTSGIIVQDKSLPAKGRKQLVLCKIAVGRSLVVQSEDEAKRKPLPTGYSSYYVCRHADSDAVVDSEPGGYCHEYILNDALQILPQYLVRFSYSALDAKASHDACALCERNTASLTCKSCDAVLCATCDQEVHSANRLVERHKRTPMREQSSGQAAGKSRRRSSSSRAIAQDTNQTNPGLSPDSELLPEDEVDALVSKQVETSMADFQGTCKLHEGKKIEFYCPICSLPVCVNCKMVGDHSIGEKGSHRLLSIGDAYERSLRESFKTDPLVDSRKSVIDNKLALISQWKQDIERNRGQVEAAIKLQYEQAMARLQEEVSKKEAVLDGEALEFQRQLQQIEWLEDSLGSHRASCSIVDFLSTWNLHKSLRAEQRDFPPSAHAPLGEDHVKADLQVLGSLQVVSGDHFEPRRSFTGSELDDQYHQSQQSGPPTPRGSYGAPSPAPSLARRPSDNEIRRKLLSMRSGDPRGGDAAVGSPLKPLHSPNSGLATLSAQGMKMVEEIRNDLLARGTIRSSSGSLSPSVASPGRAPRHVANATTTLRTFSIQPTRLVHSMNSSTTIAAPTKQRSGAAVWTALLRHELGLAAEEGPGSNGGPEI